MGDKEEVGKRKPGFTAEFAEGTQNLSRRDWVQVLLECLEIWLRR